MKIGILTHPLRTNYGGNIQAWVLQTVLERLGHEVEVFDISEKRYNHHLFLMPVVWGKRLALKMLNKYPYNPFEDFITNRNSGRKHKKIRNFIKKHIHRHTLKSLSDLQKKKFDAIVVGSDQIWRKDYAKFFWRLSDVAEIFLYRLHDSRIRKIAYAASIGVDRWEYSPEETARISEALKRFTAVSVREISAVTLLKDNTGANATHVLDPTMLLDADDYKSLLDISTDTGSRKVVSYILDLTPEKQELLNMVISTEGLKHTELNTTDYRGVMPGINDWVRGIANAEIVVTDSFHGCVFSLIFNKRLIFVRNHERGNTRFDSLIATFGIDENVVDSENGYDPAKKYNIPSNIQHKIRSNKEISLEFLLNSLND